MNAFLRAHKVLSVYKDVPGIGEDYITKNRRPDKIKEIIEKGE